VSAAWTVSNVPLLVAVWLAPPQFFPVAAGVTYLYFAVLMMYALRIVFGTGNGVAAGMVSLSWLPLVAAYFLWEPLRSLMGFIASPFILFYLFYYLRNSFGDIGSGLRRRQSFRRNLELSTINPHDGEAQYQLGLIYQERRQYTEAMKRFQNSIAIDKTQTDAYFQLGRIAREQGRLKDALGYFQTVIDHDERHHQSEILRELGALYLTARQYEHAREELVKYEVQHPYDAEGLYYHGQAMEGLGKPGEAREFYERAMEAANLAPSYIRRYAARWGRMARKQLGKLAK
jgi:tetratricopeptide (TPR) repeat protein